MQRNVTHEEVANAALFLCSGLSSGITGADHPRRRRLRHHGHLKAARCCGTSFGHRMGWSTGSLYRPSLSTHGMAIRRTHMNESAGPFLLRY